MRQYKTVRLGMNKTNLCVTTWMWDAGLEIKNQSAIRECHYKTMMGGFGPRFTNERGNHRYVQVDDTLTQPPCFVDSYLCLGHGKHLHTTAFLNVSLPMEDDTNSISKEQSHTSNSMFFNIYHNDYTIHMVYWVSVHTYICTHTYIFVVVNFDALAQASDFRIERRQVVFLCWEQDSNPGGLWNPISSRLNACWQTDWAIEDQAKTWTRQPVPMISKHSAHLTPLPFGIRTWLWRYTYLLLLISMLWHRQAIFDYSYEYSYIFLHFIFLISPYRCV